MSIWDVAKDTTIHVARQTGLDSDGVPTYGSQSTVKVRHETDRPVSRDAKGAVVDTEDVLTTDEWEFDETDAIWLPSDDETKDAQARTPQATKAEDLLSVTLYQATL